MGKPNTPSPRRVVDVDKRGRVSLAKLGFKDTQLSVETLEDGGIVLRPAIVLIAAEARHYEDPDAVAALDRALRSRAEGDIRSHKLRSGVRDA